MNLNLLTANYLDKQQATDIGFLMNAYATDPMGGGQPLPPEVLGNLAAELSKRPHALTVLCYVDGKPAGLINCFELFSTFACRPLINIHDVVVLKEYRGKKISHKMLDKVEEIAISKGCCKLTLEVLEGNQIAQASYQKFGFSPYQLDPEMGNALFWQKKIATTAS